MTMVSDEDKAQFFADVDAACKKAIWCAIATVDGDQPRVRVVHPTWDGDVLWFATGPDSPKARHLKANPQVDIQYQVAPPDFVHVMVRGTAELITDQDTKNHAWEAIDYDLTQFGSTGPEDPNFTPVKISPTVWSCQKCSARPTNASGALSGWRIAAKAAPTKRSFYRAAFSRDLVVSSRLVAHGYQPRASCPAGRTSRRVVSGCRLRR